MSAYSLEDFVRDKKAIDAVRNGLSRLRVGEETGELREYQEDFIRISHYFDIPGNAARPSHSGLMVRRIAKMFLDVTTHNEISGFACLDYENLLTVVMAMIKSKRTFRRKAAKKCLAPDIHGKGCACGNLARFKAKEDVPVGLEPENRALQKVLLNL